jgi:uncharacterized protein (TIGR03790 family)
MLERLKPALFLFLWLQVPLVKAQGSENVLLLVNEKSHDSELIGRYYAEKRKIPAKNICRIRTTEAETISRNVFDREILRPAAQHLRSNRLQDQILYIVTTRGLPLLIEGDDGAVGDLASVDSELALVYHYLLSGNYNFHGRMENPYFAVEFNQEKFRPFVRRDYDIYLVTRLTGCSAADAMLLVDRALTAESTGSFYFDAASAQESTEANWLKQSAAGLKRAGLNVTLENTGKVLELLTGVQGYANQGSADRNLQGRIPQIQWNPGAIATIIDKDTARTFQVGAAESKEGNTGWTAARYVASGVTGFGGYVADPTVDGYIRPQILFPAYAAGYNLAEAYYSALRYVSWRQVIVGDPLTSPYVRNSAKQRESMAASFRTEIDIETGLPEYFSRRRQYYLIRNYSTTREAAGLLLKAEGAADRGDDSIALNLIDGSLQQDPYVMESYLLKAEILERQQNFAESFDHYKKALEVGKPRRDLYLKLAQLALEKLKDPKRAAAYTRWLYHHFGRSDPNIARLYADVEFQNGRAEEAKAVYQLLAREGSRPPAYALAALGRIHYDEGNLELAKNFLTRALENSTESSNDTADNDGISYEAYALHLDRSEVQKLFDEIRTKDSKVKDNELVSVGGEFSGDGGIDVRPARPIARKEVEYPKQARAAGVQGVVVVRLLIDEMGQVMKSEAVQGHSLLAEAVLKEVRRWRFEPKLVRGRSEASRLLLTFSFTLKKPYGDVLAER